jgi:hypothetical protein
MNTINQTTSTYKIKSLENRDQSIIHAICNLYNEHAMSEDAKYISWDNEITITFESSYSHQLDRVSKLIDALSRVTSLSDSRLNHPELYENEDEDNI